VGPETQLSPIIAITNAQDAQYWANHAMYEALHAGDLTKLRELKLAAKRKLFEVVADQCGKLFDEQILTIVVARRFAGYKRMNLLLHDWQKFQEIIHHTTYPVQIIWAGKPYPYRWCSDRLIQSPRTDQQKLSLLCSAHGL